ncbi:MAG: hypothetical protein NWP98_07995 [Erythrobacter sp.]|nr:hypothetical protein [Erythrobacter sp.]
MPSKSLHMFAAWSNYNLTAGDPRSPYDTPGLTIENLFSLHCSDVNPSQPMEAMAATGTVLLSYLAALERLRTQGSPAGFPPREFSAATVGQGWSFAPLVGTQVAQLLASGLSWCSALDLQVIADDFCGDRSKLMIAGGGTRLRELVNVAENAGLSLPTGGTHLGQSLAGGIGTGTHGSRLGQGGLQNMVRAMHIVTGPNSHVWLQRSSNPVLTDAEIAKIVLQASGQGNARGQSISCTAISDDGHFDNALIHLGAMGIVNAVVVELVEATRFNVIAIDCPVTSEWLTLVSQSQFGAIADALGLTGHELKFYELTIDPHAPCGTHGAHLVYTDRTAEKLIDLPQETRPVPADAICSLAGLNAPTESITNLSAKFKANPLGGPSDPVAAQLLQLLLQSSNSSSVFDHYRKGGRFTQFGRPINPDIDAIASGTWGAIHSDEITGGVPGALYNASFAIDRTNTAKAVAAITAAVSQLAPSFVFTLRFVDNAAGALAFTRFAQSTVIEIDGLSPLAIALFKAQYLASGGDPDPEILAGFDRLSGTLERGALAVRAALDAAQIDFSMHWAKLGKLDAAKVAADYRAGQITAWQNTRAHLLTPAQRGVFSNPAIEHYGLVPTT